MSESDLGEQVLLPPWLHTGFHIAGPNDDLLLSDAELHSFSGFAETVRRGMVAARVAARKLFAEVGIYNVEFPRVPNRAPTWPREWYGSLSHCGCVGAAAISPTNASQGVGIDIEALTDIDEATFEVYATFSERHLCGDDHMKRIALFCGKEAAYKAFRCCFEHWLDPHDIKISKDFGKAQIDGYRPIVLSRLETLPGHVAMVAVWQ